MDEQHPAAPDGPPAAEGPHTGVAAVDEVTASIDALHARPVGEHVAVFETAHDALRRALDSDPDSDPDTGTSAPHED
ncbi:hypothetical protein [Nocardioides salarius]|uniref:hypothetical protein n=1 Tax=Nocardioides salarius TaxID=374513 RepID=UPI0030FB697E